MFCLKSNGPWEHSVSGGICICTFCLFISTGGKERGLENPGVLGWEALPKFPKSHHMVSFLFHLLLRSLLERSSVALGLGEKRNTNTRRAV